MPTSYGVTSWGFLRKPLSQIMADATATVQGIFGAGIDVAPEGPFGQIIATLAAANDEVWQLEEAIYDSMDPDAADGPRLVNLCGITGTVPKTPTQSTVTATAIGTNGSTVAALTQFQVAGNGPLFQTSALATIATLAAWAASSAYAVDQLAQNGGNVYRVIAVAGDATSGSSGGPTGTAQSITDHNVTWAYMGAGTAAVNIPCVSVSTGAVIASAFTLTVIATPVAGLASVNNSAAAVLGQAVETDAQLRLRRTAELQSGGEGSINSMVAALLEVTGVTNAFVYENNTDTTDINSLPPHSVQAVVLGGADADVAAVVFTKGGGIATYGSSSVVVTDVSGNPNTVNFSRPTDIDVWITVNITVNADTYPSGGDALVAQTLLDFGADYSVGDDVIVSALYPVLFDGISGIEDITKLWVAVGTTPTGGANISITGRQLAVFNALHIVVVSTPG
jgi:uncharacterized phage protein gp47/JayE